MGERRVIASIITVCGRPEALKRSLPQVLSTEDPVLVVDDSRTDELAEACRQVVLAAGDAFYLRLPRNRGLACALNIGLSYWLADADIKWISYFQEDVDLDPQVHRFLEAAARVGEYSLLTGRDAREHVTAKEFVSRGFRFKMKTATAGTHLFANRDYWLGVSPIPTRQLGAPMPLSGKARGLGSNVDWWICERSPKSVGAKGGLVACVPGLVRTFLTKKVDSCWDNEHLAGEDPPLSREAVTGAPQ